MIHIVEGCQRSFHLYAPGCRSNGAEGEAFAALLERAGWTRAAALPGCAVALLSGCVVTARAERDARRYALRARREASGIRVVAAGCLAERLDRFPGGPLGADLVVPLRDRSRLPGLVEALVGGAPPPPEGEEQGFFFQPTRRPAGRTRYFFKVQDGCDAACAYCLVRVVRGGVSSLPSGIVLEHARALLEGGVREIVLCGTHLGAWGRERGERLAGLVRSLDALPGEWRWRLSSLEPWDLDDELLEALSDASRFCRFFHIPLQSGSDRVLAAMGRPGSAAGLAALLDRVRARFPSARIGTDVMAGFPGETEADAQTTLDFVASSPLDYLHVFPFSSRPHRPDLRPDLAPAALTARADALRALDRRLREADRARRTGGRSVAVTAPWGGILEENLSCRFGAPPPAERLVPVRIIGWEGATARVEFAV
jgi:threonylcarbamoyladenosine tRNA methylthiotransferase MtaB